PSRHCVVFCFLSRIRSLLCSLLPPLSLLFFFNNPSTTEIYTLSLHDALPILELRHRGQILAPSGAVKASSTRFPVLRVAAGSKRSEEHTSELQSHLNLVCRLLLEKKKNRNDYDNTDTRLENS